MASDERGHNKESSPRKSSMESVGNTENLNTSFRTPDEITSSVIQSENHLISVKAEEELDTTTENGNQIDSTPIALRTPENASPASTISSTSTPSEKVIIKISLPKENITEDILNSLSHLRLQDSTIPKARTVVYFHPACKDHRYMRTKHSSGIVERPERLDAVRCAVNYLQKEANDNLLVEECTRSPSLYDMNVLDVHSSSFIKNFESWCLNSLNCVKQNQPEIPSDVDVCGDLYVCPESIDAVRGCLGALYSAIDSVCRPNPSCENAFAAVRPPGHHATCSHPMGFCFINNIAVSAMYAYRRYNIHRIAILDIDLHHGNGTQELVKNINHRCIGQHESKELKVFYGSLHDILSYPCESGNEAAVEAASLCLMQHRQYIWNIHLEEYKNEAEFWTLYNEQYRKLIDQTRKFFKGYAPQNCLIMISAGFDAHEDEYKYMQRHHRKVVHGFYHKFTSELVELAAECCGKKIISAMEGGYSDGAVSNGAVGHIGALLGLKSEICRLPLTLSQPRLSTRKVPSSTSRVIPNYTPSQKKVPATVSKTSFRPEDDMIVSPVKAHHRATSQPIIISEPTPRKLKGKATTKVVEKPAESTADENVSDAMKRLSVTDDTT